MNKLSNLFFLFAVVFILSLIIIFYIPFIIISLLGRGILCIISVLSDKIIRFLDNIYKYLII